MDVEEDASDTMSSTSVDNDHKDQTNNENDEDESEDEGVGEDEDEDVLCLEECDSILKIRCYYESLDPKKQHKVIHPWVFFIQWYRGKAYHMRHEQDPFDSSELYNASRPCIKTKKYDVMFFRRGDLLVARSSIHGLEPYVLCYDRVQKKYEIFYLYRDDIEVRTEEMNSLKAWVSKAEGNVHKDADDAIEQISDIAKYDGNDKCPHMWALFLQYFVGAALDISTCTRAIKPLERLFSDGIIYGSGYEIRFDDVTQMVYLDDHHYDIYGEDGFNALDTLKQRVFALENGQHV